MFAIDDHMWSWSLTFVTTLALLQIHKVTFLSWIVGFAAEIGWIMYGYDTGQYGFVAAGLILAIPVGHNFVLWMKENKIRQRVRNSMERIQRTAKAAREPMPVTAEPLDISSLSSQASRRQAP